MPAGSEPNAAHFVARGARSAGLEAAPEPAIGMYLTRPGVSFGAAGQPSGSKLPRHGDHFLQGVRTFPADVEATRSQKNASTPRCLLALNPTLLTLWRGSSLPLGCEAAPITCNRNVPDPTRRLGWAAAQPSGSKPPRHRGNSYPYLEVHNFFTNANHRLSFRQVRSICVNGSARLWALYGKPIRPKPWSRLNPWMKRHYPKNLLAAASSTAGRRFGRCW